MSRSNIIKNSAIVFTIVISLVLFSGCGVTNTTPATTSAAEQAAAESSGQAVDNPPSQQPGMPDHKYQPDNANIQAVLERAAEILNISSEEFIAAFQSAMPTPPRGEQTGELPAPPAGQNGTQSPPQQGEQGGESLVHPEGQVPVAGGSPGIPLEIYSRMAEELGISADDIAEAMEQAQKEPLEQS